MRTSLIGERDENSGDELTNETYYLTNCPVISGLYLNLKLSLLAQIEKDENVNIRIELMFTKHCKHKFGTLTVKLCNKLNENRSALIRATLNELKIIKNF